MDAFSKFILTKKSLHDRFTMAAFSVFVSAVQAVQTD
jgi:hypothetical protein